MIIHLVSQTVDRMELAEGHHLILLHHTLLHSETIANITVMKLMLFRMQLSRGQYDEVFHCRISEIPSLVQLCPAVLSGQDQQHRHVMPILGK